eukprot:1152277-Pelagomonas_calceolata.AAC.3
MPRQKGLEWDCVTMVQPEGTDIHQCGEASGITCKPLAVGWSSVQQLRTGYSQGKKNATAVAGS